MNPARHRPAEDFEASIAGLGDVVARSEELLASVAMAIAAELEVCRQRTSTIVVEFDEGDEITRLAALTVFAWAAATSGVRVVAIADLPRSRYAAALIGVDEIATTLDAVPAGVRPVRSHACP